MKRRLLYIPFIFIILFSFSDCAKKGNPSGGVRDTIPPVIIKSSPENFSINFAENEIRIHFDEYIKLVDLQKNLIISPPMEYAPIITPQGTSKSIKIKIIDTLKENTTYLINFGESIVDYNEENAFSYYKYVFSTGSYIDSLNLSGVVKDAKLLEAPFPTSVMLYEVNESFTDSTIYREKPTYITTTKDSTSTFELTNLKAGKYLLLALNEKTNDYNFQPQSDKIGFVKEFIDLPSDSTYVLSLFKEVLDYKIARPSQQSKYEIIFGYQGIASSLYISPISGTPEGFSSRIYRDRKTDSLHYWFRPEVESDSLLLIAINDAQIDTLNVRMKDLYSDSLKVINLRAGTLRPKDTLSIAANTPIVNINNELVNIIDKDSIAIPARTILDTISNTVHMVFDIKENQNYSVQLLPGALTDFYSEINDTLNYSVRSKPNSDYATLNFTINNVKEYPIIVQLVNDKIELFDEYYMTENTPILFEYISPGLYYIRLIFDENGNGKWDTGSYLKKIQPEKVIYYPAQLEMRANWSPNEVFNLD